MCTWTSQTTTTHNKLCRIPSGVTYSFQTSSGTSVYLKDTSAASWDMIMWRKFWQQNRHQQGESKCNMFMTPSRDFKCNIFLPNSKCNNFGNIIQNRLISGIWYDNDAILLRKPLTVSHLSEMIEIHTKWFMIIIIIIIHGLRRSWCNIHIMSHIFIDEYSYIYTNVLKSGMIRIQTMFLEFRSPSPWV